MCTSTRCFCFVCHAVINCKLRPSSTSVGMYAGESDALQELLLSQSNIDVYKRINTTAGWNKAARRTLCSAVDFSQTEHLWRFATSAVVHSPASQAQQCVKLRISVQRTCKAGQQCKEGINWTEYKDEPFEVHDGELAHRTPGSWVDLPAWRTLSLACIQSSVVYQTLHARLWVWCVARHGALGAL